MVGTVTCYDDAELCKDLSKSEISIAEIAKKHNISASLIYKIAKGTTRPELKERIDELLNAEKSAAMRLAKARARWAIARYVQIGGQNEDRKAALAALDKLAEIAGMLVESGTVDKQVIELIFSGSKEEPAKGRMTGVYNANGNN